MSYQHEFLTILVRIRTSPCRASTVCIIGLGSKVVLGVLLCSYFFRPLYLRLVARTAVSSPEASSASKEGSRLSSALPEFIGHSRYKYKNMVSATSLDTDNSFPMLSQIRARCLLNRVSYLLFIV